MVKAIVIGGGIVGSAIALKLQREGLAVTLVDSPPAHGKCASWGNAGHIAVEQVSPLASMDTVLSAPKRLLSRHGALSLPLNGISAWLPFSLRMLRAARPSAFVHAKTALSGLLSDAIPAWQRFAQDINAPDLLRVDGHFIVWNSAKSAAAGRQHWFTTNTGTARIRDADKTEFEALRRLSKKPIFGAVHCEGSGQIHDPSLLFQTLKTQHEARGIVLQSARVRALSPKGLGAEVILENGEVLNGDVIVVAAGIGARNLLQGANHKTPMIAERGYHVQYEAPAWPAAMPPVVYEDYATIVTRFDSVLRAASFVEFTHEGHAPDAAKWRRIAENVEDLGLSTGKEVDHWYGCRPTLPDYLPAIGKSRKMENVYYAFGHNHLGLTLGHLTAEYIADLICGKNHEETLRPFSMDRFVH